MADKKADWKKAEPSEKQLSFIQSLGSSETPKTAGEASEIINRLLLVQRINKIRTDIEKKYKIRTSAQIDTLTKKVDNWFWDAVLSYCAIADNCLKLGFSEPAQIGMFFNNYQETIRKG